MHAPWSWRPLLCAFALACACVVASRRAPLDDDVLDPSQKESFAVLFAADTAVATAAARAAWPEGTRVRDLMDGSGTAWVCPTRARRAVGADVARRSVASRLDRALSAVAAIVSLQACVRRVRLSSFWTYELCPGVSARQFRAMADGSAGGDASDAPPTREYSLGTHVQGSDALGVHAGGVPYLQQRYAGGTGGRSVVVEWLCRPQGMLPPRNDRGMFMPQYEQLIELISVEEEGGGGGDDGGAEASTPPHYHFTVGVSDPALCDLLYTPTQLLAPLNQTCLDHVTGGWWRYEVCLGLHIRQFHAEPSGAVTQESTLGTYNARYGEVLLEGGVTAPAVPPVSASAAAGSSMGGGSITAALSQSYTGGTPCSDISGAPTRSARVLFKCMQPVGGSSAPTARGGGGDHSVSIDDASLRTLSLLSIEEAPTCTYTLVIGTPLACRHASIAPTRALAGVPPPVTPLLCVHKQRLEELAAAQTATQANPRGGEGEGEEGQADAGAAPEVALDAGRAPEAVSEALAEAQVVAEAAPEVVAEAEAQVVTEAVSEAAAGAQVVAEAVADVTANTAASEGGAMESAPEVVVVAEAVADVTANTAASEGGAMESAPEVVVVPEATAEEVPVSTADGVSEVSSVVVVDAGAEEGLLPTNVGAAVGAEAAVSSESTPEEVVEEVTSEAAAVHAAAEEEKAAEGDPTLIAEVATGVESPPDVEVTALHSPPQTEAAAIAEVAVAQEVAAAVDDTRGQEAAETLTPEAHHAEASPTDSDSRTD